MAKVKRLTKKYAFDGVAKDFIDSNTEITVLIASRGFGKTVASSYLIAKKLTNGHSGVMMAYTNRDVKSQLLRNVIKILNSYGYIEKKHFFVNNETAELTLLDKTGDVKSILYWRSTSDPDCTRGISEASWLLVDEAAICKKEAFDTMVPVMRGEGINDVQIYLITSPKGNGNWVSTLYKSEGVNALHGSVHDCTWMTDAQRESYIARHKKILGDLFFRQEILGEIIEVNSDSVFSAYNLESLFSQKEHIHGDIIAGLDIGRKGDPCCIAIMDGNGIVKVETQYNLLTISELKGWILRVISKYPQLKRMYVDETGLGQYIPSELQVRFPSCEFIGINFGSKERKPGYRLIRSEIFFDLKNAIENKGLHFCSTVDKDIIDSARTELCAIEYTVDPKSRLSVNSKDDIKSMLGHSPDIADALALMCHDSKTVSREKVQTALKLLSKPKMAYPNKK